jgi:hypothetical protein
MRSLICFLTILVMSAGCAQSRNESLEDAHRYLSKINKIGPSDRLEVFKEFDFDINEDGVNEVVFFNASLTSAQTAPCFLFSKEPIKLIGSWDCSTIKPLESRTKGYADLRIGDPGGFHTYRWDGSSYSERSGTLAVRQQQNVQIEPFDTFRQNFFSNEQFQSTRITFPITYEWYEAEFGKTHKQTLKKQEWKFRDHSMSYWMKTPQAEFRLDSKRDGKQMLVEVRYFADFPYVSKYWFSSRGGKWFLTKLWQHLN